MVFLAHYLYKFHKESRTVRGRFRAKAHPNCGIIFLTMTMVTQLLRRHFLPAEYNMLQLQPKNSFEVLHKSCMNL